MAIYAVQGVCAAGCLYTTYYLLESGLNLPFFPKPKGVFNAAIKEIVDSIAKKMELKKEVNVISVLKQRTGNYESYGNAWLPGKVDIVLSLQWEQPRQLLCRDVLEQSVLYYAQRD